VTARGALFGGARVVVVAELAQSYEGSYEDAGALVRAAASADADAVKFQIFQADELAVPGYEYYDLYRKLELSEAQWGALFALARERSLLPMADVFGVATCAMLDRLDVAAYKVHAADMRNLVLLDAVGRTGRPVLLSCGGSTYGEMAEAVGTLQRAGSREVCLLHGFQDSPTKPEDTRFFGLAALRTAFGLPVGYADHIDGEHELARHWPLLALTAGARVIEKHFTLRRADQKEDYVSALNPDEFAEMVRHLRTAEAALGREDFDLSAAEAAYRRGFRKRVVAARDLPAGHRVGASDVVLKRAPGEGLFDPRDVIGQTVRRAVAANTPLGAEALAPHPARRRLVATLACRAGSSRLYGKPLHRIGDRTILDYLVARIRSIPRVDAIVLAISVGRENELFIDVARSLGLDYVIGDEHDVQQRLIQAGEKAGADLLLRATTESPFLHTENVEEMVARHEAENADLTVCEGLPDGAYCEIITLAALKDAHERGERRHRSELCSLYISEHPERYRIVKLLAPEPLRRSDIRLTVDYPEDLIVCRAVAEALGGDGPLVSLDAIIAYLDAHPKLKAVNGWIDAGQGRIWA
jgi:sialic acid synthase SpsE/spore coat polysaccharide biosynthesis protein SpsF (cytidylyltransferase family)